MIDLPTARSLAAGEVPEGYQLDDTGVQELRTGWFFPYRFTDPEPDPLKWPIGGPGGVIVNKQTGARFYPAFPTERGVAFYDKGYQFHRYDLVVTKIADLQRTLDTLEALYISVVEPTYAHGTVWRIARPLTRAELRSRVSKLPQVFEREPLGDHAEALQAAREKGFFQFELLECR